MRRIVMKIIKNLPEYDDKKGFQYVWENNFTISVDKDQDSIVISANKEGLESLAWQLLMLSQKEFPINTHLHYDEYNSLEEGSVELIIKKI